MPTSGTMTTSLNWIRWMNQTKTHVPRTAQTKEKAARPHRVEPGANSKASRMPNCAEEIVAPVVGETNLFMQSCCMISPATLMPMPVQRMASRRGRREIRKISHVSTLPVSRSEGRMSSTPTNREPTERISSKMPRKIVERPLRMRSPPLN